MNFSLQHREKSGAAYSCHSKKKKSSIFSFRAAKKVLIGNAWGILLSLTFSHPSFFPKCTDHRKYNDRSILLFRIFTLFLLAVNNQSFRLTVPFHQQKISQTFIDISRRRKCKHVEPSRQKKVRERGAKKSVEL